MAATIGRTDPSLIELIHQRPWQFDFFQAVRLLSLFYPDGRLLSRLGEPSDETVHFLARRSMLFPASAVQSIEQPVSGLVSMTLNFMGLTGPLGVLPTHYTEYLIEREQSHDGTAAAFFDLFNHRIISMFYLAWEKHHFPVAYERERLLPDKPSRFSQHLFCLIGMGSRLLRERLQVSDSLFLSYGGLLAQRPHSASALAGVLRDYFQVTIEIEQFVGQWCALEPDNLCYLDAKSVHSQLGGGAVAGDLLWNQQARFRIQIGPLDWNRFNSFLPGGSGYRALLAITRYFVNQPLEFELQLLVITSEVPSCWGSDELGTSPRLGLSTWLETEIGAGETLKMELIRLSHVSS